MDLSIPIRPARALIALFLAASAGVSLAANTPPTFGTSQANIPLLRKNNVNMTEDETLTIAVNSTAAFSDAALLAPLSINDEEEADNLIGIAVSAWAGNGRLEYEASPGVWANLPAVSASGPFLLGPSHRLRYVGDEENAETAAFTYSLWDGVEGTARQTFTILPTSTTLSSATRTSSIPVSAVQDAPVIASPTATHSGTDAVSLAPFAGATIDDVDRNPSDTLTLTFTVAPKSNGSLSLNGGANGAFSQTGPNTGIYTITGTEAEVEAALQAVQFQPVPNLQPVGDTTDTNVEASVSDNALPSGDDDSVDVSISIESVNDNPVVTPDEAERFVFTRGTLIPFDGFGLSDADIVDSSGARQMVSMTITEAFATADGTFVLADGSTQNADTLQFSARSIEAALTELRGLRYVASSAQLATPDSVTLTLTVTDEEGGTDTATVTVTVATPNISSNIRGTETDQVILDTGVRRLFEGVTITGTDVASLEVTALVATGSLATQNALTARIGAFMETSGGPPLFSILNNVLIFTGSASDATAALRQLAFKPFPNMLEGQETIQFQLTLKKAGGEAIGQGDNRTTAIILPVNDLPTFIKFHNLTPIADSATTRPFDIVEIGDADVQGMQELDVSIELRSSLPVGTTSNPVPGTLTGTSTPGFTIESPGSARYRFQGTPAEATLAIQALVFSPTPNRLEPGMNETVTFRVRLDDGSGDVVVRDQVKVLVISENDTPIVTDAPTGRTEVLSGNTIMPFGDAGTSLSDSDLNEIITVRIQLDDAAKGSFTDSSGLFVEAPVDSGIYLATGPAGPVQASLQGLRFALRPGYPVPAGEPGVEVSVLVTITDRQSAKVEFTFVLLVRIDQVARVVLNTGDSGAGSLRQAIEEAGDNDHIVFDLEAAFALQPTATIRLQSPLVIDKNLTITGPGTEKLFLSGDADGDGTPDVQLFQVGRAASETNGAVSAYLHVSSLTLTHGSDEASTFGNGGAFSVGPGSTLVLDHAEVLDCLAEQWGGAIDVEEGRLSVTHSLFAGNQTGANLGQGGGAISIHTGKACTLSNVTFSGNLQGGASGIGGGALYIENAFPALPMSVAVTFCTFSGNRDNALKGSAIRTNVFNTVASLRNCLFADGDPNPLDPSGAGRIVSGGGNVADDDVMVYLSQGGVPQTLVLLDNPTDRISQTVTLGTLADNGGQTRTHALPSGSPARGAAIIGSGIATDQRDVLRGSSPDAGAFEAGAFRRLVINEIQFDPGSGGTKYIEIVNPRDSESLELLDFEIWVTGELRHKFTAVSLAPGTGVLVRETAGAIMPTPPGGLPVQMASVNGLLSLGLMGGVVEIRTPDPDGNDPAIGDLVTTGMYLSRYEASGQPGVDLRADHQSVTRACEFLGGFLPGLTTPGEDGLRVPLLEGNAPPIAFDDGVETDEDHGLAVDVLANDFDADRTDVIRVESLPAAQSALGADLAIVNDPTAGAAVSYDPTGSPAIQAIPLGSEASDSFEYVILDYANGTSANSRVRDPLNPGATEEADNIERATGTVTVRIIGVNDAPTPADDKTASLPFLATAEDRPLTFAADSLLGNDTDPDTNEGGLALRICWVKPVGFDLADKDPTRVELSDLETATALGGHAKLTLRANRTLSSITYDPSGSAILDALAAGETVEDSFSYLVIDIHGAPGIALVCITVTGVNDAPVARNDGPFATNEDALLSIPFVPNVLGNDTDVDQNASPPDDVLSVNSVQSTSALGASVGLGPNGFTYDPRLSAILQSLSKKEVIEDRFDYSITDGNGGTATASVLVRVTGVNDAPIAADDMVMALEDDAVSYSAGEGVLANDTDIDMNDANPDDVLRALPVATFTSLLGATIRLYADGSFDYLPNGQFEGLGQGEQAEDQFQYTATDDGLIFANGDAFRVATGELAVFLPVLMNDVNLGIAPDEDLVVTEAGVANRGGTVVLAPNGAGVLYTPAFGFIGTETFTYEVAAGPYGFCLAEVTVEVVPSSGPIVGKDDRFTVAPNGTIALDVLANDLSLPGGTSIALRSLSSPDSGGSATIVLLGGRSQALYTPAPGFTGVEHFTYVGTVGGGTTFGASVEVIVPDRTGVLRAQDDHFLVVEDTLDNTLPVLGNDGVLPSTAANWTVDPAGLGTPSAGGTVSVSGDGRSLRYSPPAGFSGSETFGYAVRDAFGGTGMAVVTVTAGTPGFEAVDNVFAVNRNSTGNTLPVLANDVLLPANGEKIEITYLEDPLHGTVTWNSSRSAIIYTPDANFRGTDTYSYEIGAASHPRRAATVIVNVIDRTGELAASDDSFCVAGDSRRNALRVLANDVVFPLGTLPLTITQMGIPSEGGTVERGTDGAFLFYTPAVGFIGTETFSYTFTDGRGGTGSADVSVSVGGLFAGADVFTVVSDTTDNVLDVLANDRRIPGGLPDLAGISAGPSGSGMVSLNLTGDAFLYSPAPGFVGTETFTYDLINDSGETFPTAVTVRVVPAGSDHDVATVIIGVKGANDAPTISGVQAIDFLRDDDVAKPFSSVVIGEVDSNGLQILTVKVIIDDPAKGQLIPIGGGPGFVEDPPGTYTFVGTAADATAAIQALCFIPTENRIEWSKHETTTLTICVSDGIAPEVKDSGTTIEVYNIGQQFADNWIFGNGCTLSWDERRNLTVGHRMPFGFPLGGGGTWSDPHTGEWLAYSDGVTAWNAWTGQPISGANGTLGGAPDDASSIPAMIVAKPGGDPRVNLYVFAFGSRNRNIHFTEIDLSVGPNGSVVGTPGREVVGSAPSQQGWVMVPHVNGTDYWLVIGNGNAYPVTSSGVGVPVSNYNLDGSGASFRYSPDRRRIAVGWSSPKMYVYDFNPATGKFGPSRIELPMGNVFFEFSHDGTKLYVNDTGTNALYQYDLGVDPGPGAPSTSRSTAVAATQKLLHSYVAPDFAGDMALGPDGRIYIAGDDGSRPKLHVIADPDALGSASQLELDAILLDEDCDLRQGLYHGLRVDDLINEVPPGPAGPLEAGRVTAASSEQWTTVTLARSYTSMVVVATPQYPDAQTAPVVPRIRHAVGDQFEVRLARADGDSSAITLPLHYLVVEAGQYSVETDGISMEAVLFSSTVTDAKGSWNGQSRSYLNSYSKPVVVGQVMTSNDPRLSVFWARGTNASSPPVANSLSVGKHVGADPVVARVPETIGYIVLESGEGQVGDYNYAAFVGADTIRGIDDSPPFPYSYGSIGTPVAAIASSAAMDDNDGGWPVLFGPNPLTSTALGLAINEDRFVDAERTHSTEQAAVVVIGQTSAPNPLLAISVAAMDTWRQTHFEATELSDPGVEDTIWGLSADPDQDGRTNFEEYAFGFNPLRTDQTNALRVWVEPSATGGAGTLQISFLRPANDSLIRYSVEQSTALRIWNAASSRLVRVTSIPQTGYELVILALDRPPGTSNLSYRVRVAR